MHQMWCIECNAIQKLAMLKVYFSLSLCLVFHLYFYLYFKQLLQKIFIPTSLLCTVTLCHYLSCICLSHDLFLILCVNISICSLKMCAFQKKKKENCYCYCLQRFNKIYFFCFHFKRNSSIT